MSTSLDVFGIEFKGHHLVEAAAGTGKTYNITSLYVRALVEKELLPSQILVLTFTNDATSELKQRLRARIQEILSAKEKGESKDEFVTRFVERLNDQQVLHLQKCLFQFDEAAVSTIHGFCQRLLTEQHIDFKVNPTFRLDSNIFQLTQEATDIFWDDFFFRSKPTTEYERWYKQRLNIAYQSPDKLLDSIKELLENIDITIGEDGLSFEQLEDLYVESKSVFKTIKELFKNEKEALKSFFNEDALNKNTYRNKNQILADFEAWLQQKNECPTVYKKLSLFGTNLPNKYTKKGYTAPDLRLYNAIDTYIETQEILDKLEIVFKCKAVKQIRVKAESMKKQRGMLGYEDLLIKVRDGLLQAPEVCSKIAHRFQVAFIDEFQDTDHIQYSIFKSIYVNQQTSCLVMIGDPKQAIYRFRGADIHTYLAAKQFTPKENLYTLDFNYRSSRSMIEAVNALFDGINNPFKTERLTFSPAHFPNQRKEITVTEGEKSIAPFKIIEFQSNQTPIADVRVEIAKSVASEILVLQKKNILIDGSPIQEQDFTILVDTHSNGELIQDVLWDFGFKSTVRSKTSVFKSREAQELYQLLYAIGFPTSDGFLKSALLTTLMGYKAASLQKIEKDEEAWNSMQALVLDLNSRWMEHGLTAVFKRLEIEFNVLEHLAITKNPERAITNYKHLKELLINAERDVSLSLFGLLRHFKNKREDSSNAPDEEIIRLESDENLIQIVTHHASKGLEYNVVFCPFLWKFSIKGSKIPVQSNGFAQTAVLDDTSQQFADAKIQNKEDEEAEKIRLVYVALTRAKAMCVVYHNSGEKLKANSGFNAIHYLMENNEKLDQLLKKGTVAEHKTLEIINEKAHSRIKVIHQDFVSDVFSRNDLYDFRTWHSFSSLAHHSSEAENFNDWAFDYDEDGRDLEEAEVEIFNRFSLPKGKNTGNLLHAIFENIDFTNSDSFLPMIDEQFTLLGFEEKWKQCVLQLVEDAVSHKLVDGLSLSNVDHSNKLVEMEFNFPLIDLDTSTLFTLLGKSNTSSQSLLNGYMKGFIDLVIRHQGKYYILDYKSNHLGDSYDAYSNEELSEEMISANYNLQYHIYLVAFLRFIRSHNPNFDYETEFGGILYLFLRGVDPMKGASGVFCDKPTLSVLNKLDSLMGKQGET